MADATTGRDYVPGYHSPGYYGNTMVERLQHYLGKNVTVYVGEDLTSVSGMLHHVGANYVEVHRMGAGGVHEAIFVPMHQISAVAAPMEGAPHHP